LNNRQVFVWQQYSSARSVYLLEQSHVVAQGNFPFEGYISPDGKALVSEDGDYAYVEIHGTKIVTSHIQKKLPIDQGSGVLCAEGCILASDGAVYDRSGLIVNAGGWEHENITFDGRYTLQWQNNGERARVYSPVTGDAWAFSMKYVEGFGKGGCATQDGRHAIITRTVLPDSISNLIYSIPFVNDWLEWEQNVQFALIEKPGKTRAVISSSQIYKDDENLISFELSPDGRSIVCYYNGGNTIRENCSLYRW